MKFQGGSWCLTVRKTRRASRPDVTLIDRIETIVTPRNEWTAFVQIFGSMNFGGVEPTLGAMMAPGGNLHWQVKTRILVVWASAISGRGPILKPFGTITPCQSPVACRGHQVAQSRTVPWSYLSSPDVSAPGAAQYGSAIIATCKRAVGYS